MLPLADLCLCLQGLEARLEEDLAKFKSDKGLDGVKLGMGAARSLDAPEEEAQKKARLGA